MGTLIQDIRYGWRMLAKNPGFTAVAVLTLGLGIGANAAIFSAVNALLLRPLPYRNAERLVLIWETNLSQGIQREGPSGPNYLDWKEQSRSFSALAGMVITTINLTGGGRTGATVVRGGFHVVF